MTLFRCVIKIYFQNFFRTYTYSANNWLKSLSVLFIFPSNVEHSKVNGPFQVFLLSFSTKYHFLLFSIYVKHISVRYVRYIGFLFFNTLGISQVSFMIKILVTKFRIKLRLKKVYRKTRTQDSKGLQRTQDPRGLRTLEDPRPQIHFF